MKLNLKKKCWHIKRSNNYNHTRSYKHVVLQPQVVLQAPQALALQTQTYEPLNNVHDDDDYDYDDDDDNNDTIVITFNNILSERIFK